MQIVRTIIWVLILLAIVVFAQFNWQPVEVTLWDDLVWETKLPALVIAAFLGGLFPMWLYHRSVKWSLDRRLRSLENSIKSNALAKRHDPHVATAEDNPVGKPVDTPAKPENPLSSVETTQNDETV